MSDELAKARHRRSRAHGDGIVGDDLIQRRRTQVRIFFKLSNEAAADKAQAVKRSRARQAGDGPQLRKIKVETRVWIGLSAMLVTGGRPSKSLWWWSSLFLCAGTKGLGELTRLILKTSGKARAKSMAQ